MKKRGAYKHKSLTKEMFESALVDYSNGKELNEIYKDLKIERSTWRNKLDEFDLNSQYARARDIHCEGIQNKIDAITIDLLKGKIKSDVARVAIDMYKWKLSKFYPKMYGDKIDHTSDGKRIESNQLTVNYAVLSDEVLKQIADATTTNQSK